MTVSETGIKILFASLAAIAILAPFGIAHFLVIEIEEAGGIGQLIGNFKGEVHQGMVAIDEKD